MRYVPAMLVTVGRDLPADRRGRSAELGSDGPIGEIVDQPVGDDQPLWQRQQPSRPDDLVHSGRSSGSLGRRADDLPIEIDRPAMSAANAEHPLTRDRAAGADLICCGTVMHPTSDHNVELCPGRRLAQRLRLRREQAHLDKQPPCQPMRAPDRPRCRAHRARGIELRHDRSDHGPRNPQIEVLRGP